MIAPKTVRRDLTHSVPVHAPQDLLSILSILQGVDGEFQ